jgi:hypothetical protein
MSISIAKQAFEIPKKGGTSGDYLKNKKSKIMVCNQNGICDNKKVSSYEQKRLVDNGKLLQAPDDQITYDLYSSLQTQLDYEGTRIVSDISNGLITCITNKNIPFYGTYSIDPDGIMFGNTICSRNNYVNYRVPYAPITAVQTVYQNNDKLT